LSKILVVMPMQSRIIDVKNITKIYTLGEVKVPALKGVSLQINEGDFLIITGRNGSGKSTLLRQLGLLDKPDMGEILLENQEVTKMNELGRSRLRLQHLGYIFQEYALIAELSALENVILPAMMTEKFSVCKKRGMDLLTRVGLDKKYKNLPRQLSGGEQQRVAIARALINNPVVLFADEPTANLDTVASKDILNIFKELNERDKHTIVMITHEEDETKYANRLIKMSDGKII
jgi:putative ABC transport system ATP-binding protein